MIISHEHKFIFIKTAKTGGSTLENILGNHLGHKDVASGSGYHDVNHRKIRYTHKQNFIRFDYPNNLGGYSHVPASFIYKKFFKGKKPKDYFVFTIERNSYDKAISHWWWHTYTKRLYKRQRPTKMSLKQHLTNLIESNHSHNHLSCWWRYTEPPSFSDFNVDMVYQYHEWNSMWQDLSKRFSIEIDMEKTESVRFKDSKKPFDHYSHAYRDNEKELVEQVCEQEIKHFGYEFINNAHNLPQLPDKYFGYDL
tara:strand:+ start:687 stop:1442 length:756 start_codon:yes stop_codon:yes gene_type:complete